MITVSLRQKDIHSGNLILVNAQYPFRVKSMKHVLKAVNATDNQTLLECYAAAMLSGLMDRLDGWNQISAISGWRSLQEQQSIYAQSLQDSGLTFTRKFVALPGHSEHQTGLAVDLALKQENIDFICPAFPYTGICQTFRQASVSHGFIERYPQNKKSITGIAHEPWHFRYVGTPHAEIMVKHEFVLEEYIAFLKNYAYSKKHYVYYSDRLCIEISYLKADGNTDIQLEIDTKFPYLISGNNTDGFIITQWRAQNE